MSVHVAERLIDEGDALIRSARYDEAIACYERVVEQFGDADTQDLRRQTNLALTKKGSVLLDLDRLDEADAAFGALRMRIRRGPDPERALARVSVMIARLFDRRAAMLYEAGRYEEALQAYDELLVRFGDSSEPELRQSVAAALLGKIAVLQGAGRYEQALVVDDEVLERFDRICLEDCPTRGSTLLPARHGA